MQAPNIQPDVSVQDISSNVPVRGGQNTQRETASGTSFEQQLEKALKNTSDSPEYSDGQKAALLTGRFKGKGRGNGGLLYRRRGGF